MNEIDIRSREPQSKNSYIDHGLTDEFVQELESFCSLVNSKSVKIRPHSAASIARFKAKEKEQKDSILKGFQSFTLPFKAHALERDVFRSEPDLLKKIILSLGVIIDDEVYSYITQGDIIEIYNTEFKQVFRNLEFMNVCSYTLMDLLMHEPFELYERSQQINSHIFDAAGKLLNRDFALDPISLEHIPKHLIRERFSEENLVSLVELKRAFPLYKWPRSIYGWLVIQRGEPVKDTPKEVSFM